MALEERLLTAIAAIHGKAHDSSFLPHDREVRTSILNEAYRCAGQVVAANDGIQERSRDFQFIRIILIDNVQTLTS